MKSKHLIKKTLLPLSIRSYTFLLLVLMALLFSALGLESFNRLETVRESIRTENQRAADVELSLSIQMLISELEGLSVKFSNWDEFFQQLSNPSFYPYWREYRMLSSDFLPPYVTAAEAYDSKGFVLSKLTTSLFPQRIDTDNFSPFVDFINNEANLVIYLSVKREDGSHTINNGFIGLRMPLIKTLRSVYQYKTLNVDTIDVLGNSQKTLSLKEVIKHITYQLKSSSEAEAMMGVVKTFIIQLAVIVGFIGLTLYLMLIYLIKKPLLFISDQIRAFNKLDLTQRSQVVHDVLPIKELDNVRLSLNDYQSRLDAMHADINIKNEELWKQANIDPLTSIPNRRAFADMWENIDILLSNSQLGICLVYFDINHFKIINDSYGQKVGDEILNVISRKIKLGLRDEDELYRIGGDEFASVFLNCSEAKAVEIAESCLANIISNEFIELGIHEPVKVSVGIAVATPDKNDIISLLQGRVDAAIHQAKRPSTKDVVVYSETLMGDSKEQFSSWIYNAIYQAIETGEGLTIYYQPIVDMATSEVSYYETLVRIHYQDQIITPNLIFPIVESRHLDKELDVAIFKKIEEDLNNNVVPKDSGISINLSGPSVSSDELIDVLSRFKSYSNKYKLVFEVTETTLISHLGIASKNLLKLKECGFLIALDDFGSGYSSLSYLAEMPVDIIKFDISLIRNINKPLHKTIVINLSKMICEIGYDMVAEGIETEDVRHECFKAGFKYGQGYLFSKPIIGKKLAEKDRNDNNGVVVKLISQ